MRDHVCDRFRKIWEYLTKETFLVGLRECKTVKGDFYNVIERSNSKDIE
jgi:hypothetical protein